MTSSTKYPPEIHERAVRMVFEHEPKHPSQWATIRSVSSKFGMSAETLRSWVRQVERDQGRRPGLTTTEREQLKALERENRELRPHLRGGSACRLGHLFLRFWGFGFGLRAGSRARTRGLAS